MQRKIHFSSILSNLIGWDLRFWESTIFSLLRTHTQTHNAHVHTRIRAHLHLHSRRHTHAPITTPTKALKVQNGNYYLAIKESKFAWAGNFPPKAVGSNPNFASEVALYTPYRSFESKSNKNSFVFGLIFPMASILGPESPNTRYL